MLETPSGFPADLPGNVIQLRDPLTPIGWSGQTDWKAFDVRGWSPWVVRQFNDGHFEATPGATLAGFGTDVSKCGWLEPVSYAPRYTPFRSGQIRKHHAMQFDASLLKTTRITEHLSAQFGLEAFNLFNHNYFGRDTFNTDPNSLLFGIVRPATVSTQNMLPRQIQIRMKLMW